jgi:acylphosphatase
VTSRAVGYRNFVRRTSRKFKVTGYVRNLEDSDVVVVCEGDKQVIEAFIKAIQECPPPISVESAEVHFSAPSGEFDRFRIKPGELSQELIEGFETGVSYLNLVSDHLTHEIRSGNETLTREIQRGNESLETELRSGNKRMTGEIHSGNQLVTQELRSGNESLGTKMDGLGDRIDALREETGTSFTFLGERYGEISKTMVRIFDELKKERKQNHEDMKKLIASVVRRRP